MDDIITDAKALGKKIAAHPYTVAFLESARAVSQDAEARQLLDEYQKQAQRVQELETAGKAIEPDDKRKLTDCESRIAANEKLKDMTRHQMNYLDLMHRINNAIDEASQGEDASSA